MVNVNNDISQLPEVLSGVPQISVLGPILYLNFTADLPLFALIANLVDDIVVMAKSKYLNTASHLHQENLKTIEECMKLWHIKPNEIKSSYINFTLKRGHCPEVKSEKHEVKYLGIHLDQKPIWQSHIISKRYQLGIKLRTMIWLLHRSYL